MNDDEFDRFNKYHFPRVTWRHRLRRLRENVILMLIALAVAAIFIGALYLNIQAIRACGFSGWFIYGKNIYWAYWWGWCGA